MQRLLAGVALALAIAPAAIAQNHVDFAPDITAKLGSAPSLVVNPNNLAHDNGAGGVIGYLLPAGTLPANVHIEGYEALASGHSLLALDITTALPGLPPGSPAEPRDVVEYAPASGTFSKYFDGKAAGVPSNVRIDAISRNSSGNLLLSFDISVTLPGVGAVDDEDVVVYSGGTFAMAFNGSAAGVASATDLDALQAVPGALLVSFDTSGSVGGVTFDDEDVLRFDTGASTWSMYFDGSVSDPVNWPKADLVALPEPEYEPAFVAGAALLAAGARLRHRRSG